MNIQEILDKLTDAQKRMLIEASTKAEAIERQTKSKEVIANKPMKPNWICKVLGGDLPYNVCQDSKFWSYDRKITLLTFVFSLGIFSLVDFLPKIMVFFIFPSFFWISFMFSRLNQVSVIEIAKEEGEGKKIPDYTIFNFQGKDITKKAEKALAYFPLVFMLAIFTEVAVADPYNSYINAHFAKELFFLFFLAPGYIIFFGYFFITGMPLSLIYKSYPPSFYSHGQSSHKPHEWISSNHIPNSRSEQDYWSYRNRNGY